jgi:N-acetyl-beta-hexosaminidase
MGQLDPSLDLTWQVLTDVLKHLKSISLTDYVHLGGDEVVYDCWNTSNINSYM